MSAGKHEEAYRSFYRAGWEDLYSNDMETVLERLLDAARKTGSKALTALAELHLETCRSIS